MPSVLLNEILANFFLITKISLLFSFYVEEPFVCELSSLPHFQPFSFSPSVFPLKVDLTAAQQWSEQFGN